MAHQYGQETKGLLAELPLSPEGRFLLDATDPTTHFHPKHQKWTHPRLDEPHVHHVMTRGNEVLACDLGTNKVWRLRRGDSTKGEDAWVVNGAVQDGLADGDGPRHAAIHPERECTPDGHR
jgi:6-phosphogluconolactonase (cycloisomerase 2 family)